MAKGTVLEPRGAGVADARGRRAASPPCAVPLPDFGERVATQGEEGGNAIGVPFGGGGTKVS
jgi:hypothetical protein